MKTVLIHGLNSSHRSFNYIRNQIYPDAVMVDYTSHQALEKSLAQVARQLPKDEGYELIGHSLGGVISVLLTHLGLAQPERVTTISSPLGGSKAASIMRWLAHGIEVFNDITPHSKHIKSIQQPLSVPLLSIISTGGSLPTSTEPNDSVVTVSSQRALPYGKKVEVKASHFEVLLHDRTLDILRKHA